MSVSTSLCLSLSLRLFVSVCLRLRLNLRFSVWSLSACLSVCLSVVLPVSVSVSLHLSLSLSLSIYLSGHVHLFLSEKRAVAARARGYAPGYAPCILSALMLWLGGSDTLMPYTCYYVFPYAILAQVVLVIFEKKDHSVYES